MEPVLECTGRVVAVQDLGLVCEGCIGRRVIVSDCLVAQRVSSVMQTLRPVNECSVHLKARVESECLACASGIRLAFA